MKMRTFLCSVVAVALMVSPAFSNAQVAVGVSIHVGPPALPVYTQPPCPEPGYMWTPGYWAYGPDGYYWVPGAWVAPPAVGLLWTPGYWGFVGGAYGWHAGYWGPHIGFYGGINYGFGYGGVGFVGGYWHDGSYFYNRSVTNINVTVIHNTYVKNVVVNRTVNHTSFNGPGGITSRPTAEERRFESEHHVEATRMQTEHEHTASTNRSLLASANHGRPPIAATARAGEFNKGVVASRGANNASRPAQNNAARNASYNRSNNNNNANRNNSFNRNNNNSSRNTNNNAARSNNNRTAAQNHGGGSQQHNAPSNQNHKK